MRRLLTISCLQLLLALPAPAGPPRVVTDIAPVQSLVAQIMKGVGAPALLLPATVSPHHFSLRPSQAQLLSEAEIVFWIGKALTPWLEDSLQTLAPDAPHIDLSMLPGLTLHASREEPEFLDQSPEREAGHDDHDQDDADKHEHEGLDPHLWLDYRNAGVWLQAIAAELTRADPENAELYADNLAEALDGLDRVGAEIGETLAPVSGSSYIVLHDAYQYFERRFGLSPAGAIAVSEAATPGPARIAALRRLVEAHDIVCAFAEPQLSDRLIKTVGGDRELRIGRLDPLGVSILPGPALYGELLRAMAHEIRRCLGGG